MSNECVLGIRKDLKLFQVVANIQSSQQTVPQNLTGREDIIVHCYLFRMQYVLYYM